MNHFFTTSPPMAIEPLEINNQHTILNKYKQAEKSFRRAVVNGFPKEEKFSSIEEIREYLGGDRITCLLCGRSFKGLCGHLSKIHNMSTDDYKEKYGLPFRSGLQSYYLTEIYRERGRSPKHLAHLASIRTPENIALMRVAVKTQRISTAKTLQTKENVKKSPLPTDHFGKADVENVLDYMNANDCSLSKALKDTKIMGATCFAKTVKKFPELNFSKKMNEGSKGKRSPIKNKPKVIELIKSLRSSGIGFKQIALQVGIHEEYASLLYRRSLA